jgi:chromosome segregation ATPase
VEVKPIAAIDSASDAAGPATNAPAPVSSGELSKLVNQALFRIEHLQQLLAQAAQQHADAQQTADQLHERLRLGARMLQAFGAQLNRLEAGMARTSEHRAHLDKLHEAAQQRIDAVARRAAERIESRALELLAAMEARGKTLETRLRTPEEDHPACAAVDSHSRASAAVHEKSDAIVELAEAMRALAARVEHMSSTHQPRQDDAPALRLQSWAGHG